MSGHWKAMATVPEDLPWLIERVGCFLTPAAKGVKVVGSDGATKAMALFDRWTYNCAEAHIAVDEPMALRTLCRETFPWYFAERGVLLGIVRASNVKAMRLDLHLGFKEQTRIENGVAQGEDLVILRMLREECRWVKPMARFERGDRVVQVREDEALSDVPRGEVCVVTSNWASQITMRVRRPDGTEGLVDARCFEKEAVYGNS